MCKAYWIVFSLVVMVPVPLVALASGGEGDGGPHPEWMYVIFHAINLTLLVFILYKLSRKKVRGYLVHRQDSIRDALERAEAARLEAEEAKREYERRLAGLDDEMAQLRREMDEKGKEEAASIVENARTAAARMKEDAKRLLNDELSRARHQLRQEAVGLAIELARRMLQDQVNESDQRRIAEEYLSRVAQSTEIH